MLLRQMKYFVSVVERGSFTEAAEQCYISQSAMSQQIQALEKDLGVTLLSRGNRRFSLTPAGEYFYRHSKGILAETDTLRRETLRLARRGASRLRIGYLRGYSGLELSQAVADFSRQFPETAIDIVNGTHEELYTLLRLDGVDLVLSDQRRAFSDEYVNFELLKCGCCVEISARSPLSAKSRLELEELSRLPCILLAPPEQREAEQDYYQNTLGFSGSFLFAESLEEGRLMAAGGRGFLPVESIGTLPPAGAAVRRLPLFRGGRRLLRNYCLFWRSDRTCAAIEAFADSLRALFHPS